MAVSIWPSVSEDHGVSLETGVSPFPSVSINPQTVVSADQLLLVTPSSAVLLMSGSNLLLMV